MWTDPTNDDRADWAQAALNEFARVTRMDTAGEDTDTTMGDLLCDLMHLAQREGLDFTALVARAQCNYDEEVRAAE